MKTILDIMRADLITANGSKHSFTRFLILSAVVAVAAGILFSPFAQFVILLIIAAMTVSSLYQAAEKTNAEKMFSVLPVKREQIVLARFLLSAGIFAAICLLCAVCMPLTVKLQIYVSVLDMDIDEMLVLLGNVTGFRKSELGLYLIVLCAAFWLGMVILPRSMRRYLRNTGKVDDGKKMFRTAKKVFTVIGIYLAVELILGAMIGLSMQSAIFGTLMMLLMRMIGALAQTGGGVSLCSILLTMGICTAMYQYVCAVIEHDEKEL